MLENEETYHLILNRSENSDHSLKKKLWSETIELNKPTYDSIKVYELLEIVGSDKKFQKTTLAILSFLSFSFAISTYFLPFIFYRPKFFCFDESGAATQCEEQVACSNPFGFETRSDKFSSVDEYKIYCDRHYIETYAKSILFFMAATPTLIISILSDHYGRRPMIVGSSCLMIFGCILAYFAHNFELMILGIVFTFIGCDLFFSIASIYTNEIIGSKIRNMGNGVTYFFFGLGGIFLFVVNIWIDHYKVNFLILLGFGVVCLLLTYSLMETPYIFFKHDDLKKLYDCLCAINVVNFSDQIELANENRNKLLIAIFQDKLSDENIYQCSSIKIKRTKTKFQNKESYFKFMNYGLAVKIVLLSIIFTNIYIGYGLSLLIPATLGIDNIYLNGILLGISETIGYLVITFNAHRTPRKLLNIVNSSSTIILSLTLLYLSHYDTLLSLELKKVLQTVISVVIKLFFCMNFTLIFNYSAELVPTNARGFTSGFTMFFGRISTTACSFLEQATISRMIHPMAASAIPSFLALPISFMLPETLGQHMPN
jgi:OCT family organic cation transporter-like MFS transporter 4/5